MSDLEALGLSRTPIFPLYARYGARVVDFHGWQLPVQFSGIIDEHRAVRADAGLFDVSHMGEIEVTGPGALPLVQALTVNDASLLHDGQVQYSAMCYDDGGIVDDLTVYRFSAERYLLCVNAACREKDLRWVEKHRRDDASVADRSARTALLAVQGPKAQYILNPMADVSLQALGYYRFVEGRIGGIAVVISRTGYTGEDGFEIFAAVEDARELWQKIMAAGGPVGMKPAGLGARDTLRLEMKYALYGSDIDETTDPLEAGLGWITKLDKGDFLGREAIIERSRPAPRRRLVGFEVQGRGVVRPGCPLFSGGRPVGAATSGTFSPSLGRGIGMGYVPAELAGPGTALEAEVRASRLTVHVVKPPFYKEGSIRKQGG